MAQLPQGQRLTLPITATQGYYFSTSGAAIVRVTPSNGGAFVVTIGANETDVGWFGFDASLELVAQSGVLTYNTAPSRLTAVQLGDQRDSDPVDVALSYGDLAAAVNKSAKRLVTPYDYGLTDSSTIAQATAAFQAMFDANTSETEFRFAGDVTLSSLSVTNKTRCIFDFGAAVLRFTSPNASMSFDEVSNSYISLGSIQPYGARSGTDIGVRLAGLAECNITILVVGAFTKPIQVNPIGAGGGRVIDGFFYNSLNVYEVGSQSVSTSAVEITTTGGTTGAYVNENEFNIRLIKALGTGISFVKGTGQTDPFNGNTLYKSGFEHCVNIGLDMAFCTLSQVVYPRFESQFAAGRFNTALIRESSDCSQNIYSLGSARNDKLLLSGQQYLVTGTITDGSQNRIGNQIYQGVPGTGKTFSAYGTNFNPSNAANLTEFINGNVLATDNNKPYAKYLRYVKGADGVVRGAGFVQPFSQNLISSWTNGQVIDAGLSSFIRVSGGTSGNVLNLRMSVDREIDGFSCLLEITAAGTEVNIQNSSGAQQVALTAFQNGGDARGLFAVVYRDFGWRISQLGGVLKNA